jgi:glycosyltransferase involved in cell wall biosynthesis
LRGKKENGFCILAMPELLDYAPKGLYMPHPINVEEIEPQYEMGNKIPVAVWYRSIITRVDIIEKASRDLDSRCVFQELKGLTHEEALNAIAKSDVFIDVRTNGWYGLSAAEAMACGKPVIGDIRVDFAKKYNPPVTPYNAEENLTGTLLSLLSDSKLKRRKGQASRSYAETEHNVKDVVDKLLVIYGKLIEN